MTTTTTTTDEEETPRYFDRDHASHDVPPRFVARIGDWDAWQSLDVNRTDDHQGLYFVHAYGTETWPNNRGDTPDRWTKVNGDAPTPADVEAFAVAWCDL